MTTSLFRSRRYRSVIIRVIVPVITKSSIYLLFLSLSASDNADNVCFTTVIRAHTHARAHTRRRATFRAERRYHVIKGRNIASTRGFALAI